MIQKACLNSAPSGFGVPRGVLTGHPDVTIFSSPSPVHPPSLGPPRTPGVKKLQNFMFSWWSPVGQNITVPGPETELYGVKQQPGVVRWPRVVHGHLGVALGTFSSRH